MCRFDLFSNALIRLLGALPDRFTSPGEPVPPNIAALVDTHFYRPTLTSSDISRVVLRPKSTAPVWQADVIKAAPVEKMPRARSCAMYSGLPHWHGAKSE